MTIRLRHMDELKDAAEAGGTANRSEAATGSDREITGPCVSAE